MVGTDPDILGPGEEDNPHRGGLPSDAELHAGNSTESAAAPPEMDEAQILAALLDTRKEAVKDQALLTREGIQQAAEELGMNWSQQALTEFTKDDFVKGCAKSFGREEHSLFLAFVYVSLGQIDIENETFPQIESLAEYGILQSEEAFNPIQAYLAGLRYIERFRDNRRGELAAGFDREAEAAELDSARWKEAWRNAVDGTVEFRDQVAAALQLERPEDDYVGRPANFSAMVHDTAGKPIVGMKSIGLWKTTLLEDRRLQHRVTPGSSVLDLASLNFKLLGSNPDVEPTAPTVGAFDTFVERMFPASRYPDRQMIADIEVEHIALMLPLAPPAVSVEYTPQIQLGAGGQALLECITGEGRTRPLLIPAHKKGGVLPYEPPSDTNRGESNRLKATIREGMGEIRADSAEIQGDEASTSVVIVLKPVINAGVAKARRQMVRYAAGEIDLSAVAKTVALNRDAEPLSFFVQRGIITDQQAQQIEAAKGDVSTEDSGGSSNLDALIARSKIVDDTPRSGHERSYSYSGAVRSVSPRADSGGHTGIGGKGSAKYSSVGENPHEDPLAESGTPRILVIHNFIPKQGQGAFPPADFARELLEAVDQQGFEGNVLISNSF